MVGLYPAAHCCGRFSSRGSPAAAEFAVTPVAPLCTRHQENRPCRGCPAQRNVPCEACSSRRFAFSARKQRSRCMSPEVLRRRFICKCALVCWRCRAMGNKGASHLGTSANVCCLGFKVNEFVQLMSGISSTRVSRACAMNFSTNFIIVFI